MWDIGGFFHLNNIEYEVIEISWIGSVVKKM